MCSISTRRFGESRRCEPPLRARRLSWAAGLTALSPAAEGQNPTDPVSGSATSSTNICRPRAVTQFSAPHATSGRFGPADPGNADDGGGRAEGIGERRLDVRLDWLSAVCRSEGPVATVVLDVSHNTEDADHRAALRRKDVAERL